MSTMNTIDWEVVEKFIKEFNPQRVSIGMNSDWYWTAQTVWENGEWQDLRYLIKASNWAHPCLEADFEDGTIRRLSCSKIATEPELEAIDQERQEHRKETCKMIEKIKANPLYGI